MKIFKIFILIFFIQSLANSAELKIRFTNIRVQCKNEIENVCKFKQAAPGGSIRKCLDSNILFLSSKCEDELDFFYKNFSTYAAHLVEKCKKDLLTVCAESEIKDTSYEKFQVCGKKLNVKTFSKPCEELIKNIYK